MSSNEEKGKNLGEKEIKTFVIDTNVLIHRPDALWSFKDNEIVIPLWVLEELDKLKIGSEEKARNARQAIGLINNISKKGKLSDGVHIQEINSFLKIAMTYATETSINLDTTRMDNRIILCALELKNQGRNVFFVSKDINARVKAQAFGLVAVDYEKQKVNIDSLYTGFDEIEVEPSQTIKLKKEGQMPSNKEFVPNQFVKVNTARQKDFVLTQWNHNQKKLLKVAPLPRAICGIHPLNLRQQLAFQLLLDPSIPLVTLVGKAGTGKTLLAIAAALEQTLEQHLYTKILVSRPVLPLGKDIGFLPGNKEEKMSNWMQPLFDNLDFLISQAHNQAIQSISQLTRAKIIEIEALSLMRGRSLPKQFIIIDEAQNLSPHEIKTVVSRAGKETKMVFSGDPYQIDNPYLDSSSNGLSYLVDTLKGQLLFGHIFLDKSERSALSDLATELL